MPTIYVNAKSKKEINDSLKLGKQIVCIEYLPYTVNEKYISDCTTGTVVKIFEKYVGGSPLAKSYGVWNKEKNQIK